MLMAVPMLPMPEESVQKSVLCPTENVFAVSGAYLNQPTSGALPAPYSPSTPLYWTPEQQHHTRSARNCEARCCLFFDQGARISLRFGFLE